MLQLHASKVVLLSNDYSWNFFRVKALLLYNNTADSERDTNKAITTVTEKQKQADSLITRNVKIRTAGGFIIQKLVNEN